MADTFGTTPTSRVQADSSRFYAVAVTDVPANAIYVPLLEGSGLFGVAEVPVAEGELGAFAREGIFAFDYPEDTSEPPASGTPVYYAATSAVAGTFAFEPSNGAIFVGYVVECPNVNGKLCVLLAPNAYVSVGE